MRGTLRLRAHSIAMAKMKGLSTLPCLIPLVCSITWLPHGVLTCALPGLSSLLQASNSLNMLSGSSLSRYSRILPRWIESYALLISIFSHFRPNLHSVFHCERLEYTEEVIGCLPTA